jgi:hemerythrin
MEPPVDGWIDFAATPWDTSAASLNWSERYPLGEPTIDDQHQSIFRLVCAFMDASDVTELQVLVNQLLQCARAHFDYEEALMQKLDFGDFEEHAHSHRQLLERLDTLRQRISGGPLDKMEMNVFFKHWAFSHLPVADARFSEFLAYDGRKSSFL